MEQRRTMSYPWTWELPAAVICIVAIVAVMGVHLGRALAFWADGRGLLWAGRDELFTLLGGIMRGNANAGLAQNVTGVSSASLAWSIGLVELVLLAAAGYLVWAVLVRWGPAAPKGVASAGEAERLLGRARLRRVRRIIRPDLHRPGVRTLHTGQQS